MVDIKNQYELREFIRQHYLRLLEREPDFDGLQYYFLKITNGEIKPEELRLIIEESKEYLELQNNKKLFEKISQDIETIFNVADYEYIEKEERLPEPTLVFVSCYNGSKDFGGVYLIKDDFLKPIFEGHFSVGLFYEKTNKILFCLIQGEPQIWAYRIHDEKFIRIPVRFLNYVYGNAPHGLYVYKNKIYVIASEGQPNSEKAVNDDIGKFVGKIIVSDLLVKDDEILISNSKIYNPFQCLHHHHINEICEYDGTMYITSFSYCNSDKQYIKNGAIAKLDQEYGARIIIDKLVYPHSPKIFRNKLYVCSSGIASIFSINLSDNSIKLEYKGVDAHIRGLLVTDTYFYIGVNYSVGRTNSKFTNPTYGILQFNRDNGETKRIPLPPNCNNVYSISSD